MAQSRAAPSKDDWQGKDDARTLTEAEAIRADGKRLKGAHKHLKHAAKAANRALSRTSSRR